MASDNLSTLFDALPQVGEVRWIGLTTRPRGPIVAVAEVLCEVGPACAATIIQQGGPAGRGRSH